jgi:hypothetical protein
MANVSFFFANPVFQANGPAAWNMPVGDRDNCWSFSARPFQANDRVILHEVAANSDNNLNQSTDIVITMAASGGGGLIRLTAMRVSS